MQKWWWLAMQREFWGQKMTKIWFPMISSEQCNQWKNWRYWSLQWFYAEYSSVSNVVYWPVDPTISPFDRFSGFREFWVKFAKIWVKFEKLLLAILWSYGSVNWIGVFLIVLRFLKYIKLYQKACRSWVLERVVWMTDSFKNTKNLGVQTLKSSTLVLV